MRRLSKWSTRNEHPTSLLTYEGVAWTKAAAPRLGRENGEAMSKQVQYGCKNCGAVVTVDIQPWLDRLEVRVKDGKVHDAFGRIEIQCNKCGKAVAVARVNQV